MKFKGLAKYFPTIIKYLLCFVFFSYIFIYFPSKKYMLTWLCEMTLIACTTNIIMVPKSEAKHATLRRILGRIFNTLTTLLMLIQLTVFHFSNSYISLVMMTNLDNLKDQTGRISYFVTVGIIILISIIPVEYFAIIKPGETGEEAAYLKNRLISILIINFCLVVIGGMTYYFEREMSTAFAYINLITQNNERIAREMSQDTSVNITSEFYHYSIDDMISRPDTLDENPNIIIVMTEGMSSNIIEDERCIMPRMKELEETSISFDNYYNHTFATYRGISGQLYSGFQNNNYDINTLTSIMSITGDLGYHTIFINTEPDNVTFDEYLDILGFDDILTADSTVTGAIACVPDSEAYQLLYETIEKENETGTPYLIVMYTFCTHNSFDSPDQIYGDGSVNTYNRFYNADYHFGTFFDKWSECELSDNSLFIMTTDHATYSDLEYATAFPEHYNERPAANIDEIPFIMWHKGVEPAVYDANGRNSLDLVPTILDYADIDAENYFLGNSLFSKIGTDYDIIFHTDGFIYSTNKGHVNVLTGVQEDDYWDQLYRYFTAKEQSPEQP